MKSFAISLLLNEVMSTGFSSTEYISCPVINCDTTIGNFNCFQHSATTPVESIDTYLCPYD